MADRQEVLENGGSDLQSMEGIWGNPISLKIEGAAPS